MSQIARGSIIAPEGVQGSNERADGSLGQGKRLSGPKSKQKGPGQEIKAPNRQGGPPGAWRTSDAPVLPERQQRSKQGRGPFSTALEGKVKSNQGPLMRRRASGAL